MKVKTPKKRKPAQVHALPPSPAPAPALITPEPEPASALIPEIDKPVEFPSPSSTPTMATVPMVTPKQAKPKQNEKLTETQELKVNFRCTWLKVQVKNVLLQWQIYVLRRKLAGKFTGEKQKPEIEHEQKSEEKQEEKSHLLRQHKQQQKQQQKEKQYQIPFLLSGRELKEKKLKEKEPRNSESVNPDSDLNGRPAMKRKRSFLDKKASRPLKKAKSTPEVWTSEKSSNDQVSALFSQHNRDLELDVENKPSTEVQAPNAVTSDSRLTEKTPEVYTKANKNKPFFDVKKFLDIEASVEKGKSRKEDEEEYEEAEAIYKEDEEEDEIEDEDEMERKKRRNRHRNRKNRHVANKGTVEQSERSKNKDAVEQMEVESKKAETHPTDVVLEEPKAKNVLTSTETSLNEEKPPLFSQVSQIPFLSTQDFVSFLGDNVIPSDSSQVALSSQELEAFLGPLLAGSTQTTPTKSMPEKTTQTPNLTPIKRTSALTNLMEFTTNKAQPSPIKKQDSFGVDDLDLLTLSQIPTSFSQIAPDGLSASQLDWTLDQLKSLLVENGLPLSLSQA